MENVNDKNRKLIKALELIGNYELMKPIDKIDGDLIDATVDWSLRLQNKDITLSTEEIEKMVSMIPFDDTEELETNGEVPNSRKVLKKNKVLFIAAVIAILVTLLTIVSVAFEWNIFEELKNRFGTVADTPVNEEMVVNGITVVKNDQLRSYQTISEALKDENIEVLYPMDINVKKIVLYQNDEQNKLSFVFDRKNITFEILLDDVVSSDMINVSNETENIEGLLCYICELEDVKFTQFYFDYDGNLYMLSGDNKQELIKIVENLKELE